MDDVLARLPPAPDPEARLVEAARAGLNYLENTEGEFGITLGSAAGLRAAPGEDGVALVAPKEAPIGAVAAATFDTSGGRTTF